MINKIGITVESKMINETGITGESKIINNIKNKRQFKKAIAYFLHNLKNIMYLFILSLKNIIHFKKNVIHL